MKLLIGLGLVLGLMTVVVMTPTSGDSATAAEPSAFVGDWEAIHPNPAVPNAELSIRGRHVSFHARLVDPLAVEECEPDGPAMANGTGRLDASGHLVVDMRFRCLDDGSKSIVPFTFTLAPGDPNQMADQTGLVWHRVGA